MSTRSRILERALTTLLRSAARLVRSDRAFHAPSLDRESLAEVIDDALRLGILDSAEIPHLVHAIATLIEGYAADPSDKVPDDLPSEHPIKTLTLIFSIMVASDLVAARLLLGRAFKSKGFAAHVSDEALGPTDLDRLAILMSSPQGQALLKSADLDPAAVQSALVLSQTRLLLQRHGVTGLHGGFLGLQPKAETRKPRAAAQPRGQAKKQPSVSATPPLRDFPMESDAAAAVASGATIVSSSQQSIPENPRLTPAHSDFDEAARELLKSLT